MTARAKKVQKPVVYKRVEFFDKKRGDNLKTLLDAALAKRATVGDRRRNVGDADSPMWQLIGASTSEKEGFIFGMLMTYSPGTDPLFFVDDESAETITLEKLKAPETDEGKRRELLESIMFFGVVRNHLVLMQSHALKAPQFEQYLLWLLRQAEVIAPDNFLSLIDTPTQAIKDRVTDGNGVREIRLDAEVLPASKFKYIENELGTATRSITVATDANSWGPIEAIKSMLKPSQAALINFDKLDKSNIELSMTLRYKTKTTDDGHKLMDNLGALFRNTEEVESIVELMDGSTIRGSELKLHGKVGVTSYDGQLSASEVNEALRQWLISKVKESSA